MFALLCLTIMRVISEHNDIHLKNIFEIEKKKEMYFNLLLFFKLPMQYRQPSKIIRFKGALLVLQKKSKVKGKEEISETQCEISGVDIIASL